MKLGFLTACFRTTPLEDIIRWAGLAGFSTLELASWPIAAGDRGSNHLDVAGMTADKAAALNALCAEAGVEISCLTYCANPCAADPAQRQAVHAHVKHVIDAANLLGVGVISTFVGRNEKKVYADAVTEAIDVFRPLLAYAADKGVKVAIENYPGVGMAGEALIGNLFASPATWEQMFDALPVDNFGLNYDPSHLYWQGVDYLKAAKDFSERIFHVHAKDTEVFADRLAKGGSIVPGNRWWRYRIPGFGKIEWPQLISILIEGGYDYTMSFEHEDSVWSGTDERVTEGLVIGKQYLSTFMA
jgi:sugar phosphate isomerase/epimerase